MQRSSSSPQHAAVAQDPRQSVASKTGNRRLHQHHHKVLQSALSPSTPRPLRTAQVSSAGFQLPALEAAPKVTRPPPSAAAAGAGAPRSEATDDVAAAADPKAPGLRSPPEASDPRKRHGRPLVAMLRWQPETPGLSTGLRCPSQKGTAAGGTPRESSRRPRGKPTRFRYPSPGTASPGRKPRVGLREAPGPPISQRDRGPLGKPLPHATRQSRSHHRRLPTAAANLMLHSSAPGPLPSQS